MPFFIVTAVKTSNLTGMWHSLYRKKGDVSDKWFGRGQWFLDLGDERKTPL
jgi:hypothetical protein